MTTITIASNKGGVGKTTTAVSIATILATLDPTLLIDLDPQGHSALSFGHDPRPGVFDWLVNGNFMNSTVVPRPDCQNLFLLPGDSRTKTVDLIFRAEVGGSQHLVDTLRHVGDDFRWIVIDTPAGGLLQECALAVADQVVIPFRPETLGVDGVHAALALLERINTNAHAIILPVAYDRRLREHRQNVADVTNFFHGGNITVAAPIPARVAVAEAVSLGRTIWEHKDTALADVRIGYTQAVDAIRAFATHQQE